MRFLGNKQATLTGALLEIVLIFVGMSVAIAVDNWSGDRKARANELEMLRNFDDDLRVMMARSEEALRFNEACYQAGAIILTDLENPAHKVYSDTLDKYYGKFYFYDNPEIKQSGLLTLQSVGMDLITNDSLRTEIIDFYDLHSLRASYLGDSYTNQYNDVINPIMHDHIRILSIHQEARPIDYMRLKKDKIAINTLNNILFQRLLLMKHIRSSIPLMKTLQEKIREEIKRLDK